MVYLDQISWYLGQCFHWTSLCNVNFRGQASWNRRWWNAPVWDFWKSSLKRHWTQWKGTLMKWQNLKGHYFCNITKYYLFFMKKIFLWGGQIDLCCTAERWLMRNVVLMSEWPMLLQVCISCDKIKCLIIRRLMGWLTESNTTTPVI